MIVLGITALFMWQMTHTQPQPLSMGAGDQGDIASLRDRLASARDALRDPSDPATDRLRMSAEIPGADDTPLWKLDLQMLTEPHGDGEKMRLRAHFQTNFGSALRPAIAQVLGLDAFRTVPVRNSLGETVGSIR